jgi:acyl-CoA reductase-like NAD-dependent aldehyde dehydrogenase
MLNIPAIRWGKPYESLEVQEIHHFITGEAIAKVSQANPGILHRDMKRAQQAREILREIPADHLIERVKNAAGLYRDGNLPMGDGTQNPAEFARAQSATTGLPEHMCRANMEKNFFVLTHMDQMLDALTRGLPPDILTRGYGVEGRGSIVSYQAQSPVLGLVLPSNSPGVHTLWLPVIPMQLGLVLKPGPLEPWTPYRMQAAFVEAGIPAEAISIYPGEAEMGAAVVSGCKRVMIFGGEPTVERYKGNDCVQVHGPGYSKILLGDDCVDDWEQYIDLMADSIFLNSGRGCINCSGIWASRHTKEIAQALAERLGPIEVKPPDDPKASIAAFTNPGMAEAIWNMIEADLKEDGVEHCTAPYGDRFEKHERCGYLRATIIHCNSPSAAVAKKEFMFPFATVVQCPQEKMLESIGPTLVGTAITNDEKWQQQLIGATHINRLNLGPIPTIKLDWLQPHEGNIVDFLFRARALQVPQEQLAALGS